MTRYRDNYPHNIEAPQKLYIQYSHDIDFDYSTGKYPDGTEDAWDWEEQYIPIAHEINGREVGRHEWMRIKVGTNNVWTHPILFAANVTNISSVSTEVIIEDGHTFELLGNLLYDGEEIDNDGLSTSGKDFQIDLIN